MELAKFEPLGGKFKKEFNLKKEPKDPPMILQNMYNDRRNGGHTPFLLFPVINNLILHNCMLDSSSFANVMPLRIMNKLEMEITRPYKNVSGFDSKSMPMYGLMKDIQVSLDANKDILVLMDIVVIDVLDAWGMLKSMKWCASIERHLKIDLS